MQATRIWFDDTHIYVETDTHQQGAMPLGWFPKLQKTTMAERQEYELWADKTWIHWEKVGEDLSVEGFFNFSKA